MKQFDRMASRFDRIPEAFRDFSDTPQEQCETHKDSGSCKSDGCSWCDAGAVKPACNSLENAARLPPAVFTCDPLPGVVINKEFEDEEEEEPESLWGQFVQKMHGGRRGRHHEGRPQHGGRHHGGKHPRGPPPPPMEDDEEESFYGQPPRPPRHPRVQSEEHHGRHG